MGCEISDRKRVISKVTIVGACTVVWVSWVLFEYERDLQGHSIPKVLDGVFLLT